MLHDGAMDDETRDLVDNGVCIFMIMGNKCHIDCVYVYRLLVYIKTSHFEGMTPISLYSLFV